jgi:NAD(P)-dependent dehydrogenase (short-subunit alcohol dehydrogenase family)
MAQTVQAAREVRGNLQAMQQAGAQVLYCVADVADEASARRALDRVRAQWGPITGLVHGAGVVADKLIKDKTLDQYDSVFATKVEGLRVLLDALAGDPLRALVMFSSVAARVGNPGQSDYAMANEVLNQVGLVEAQRRPGCLVRAIGWGPWDGGMVTPALRAHFDAQGVSLIPPARGAAAFLSELRQGESPTQLVVGTGEPRELLARDTGHRGVVSADIVLDPQRHEFLRSHCIGADPVVPVVLVAEWFVRAAMALVPGAGLPALSDLRVLRGIVLADWERRPHRFRLTVRFDPGAGRRLRCEVRSIDGSVIHYAATADFGTPSETSPRQPQQTRALHVGDVSCDAVYTSPALFHGPDLQAVRRFSTDAGGTVRAELYGRWALGWGSDDLLLDIPALDGGLQVALCALFEADGACMLPTRLGAVHLMQEPADHGPIRCTLNLQASDPLHAVCDITITGGGWSVSMTDVELHTRVAVPATTISS